VSADRGVAQDAGGSSTSSGWRLTALKIAAQDVALPYCAPDISQRWWRADHKRPSQRL